MDVTFVPEATSGDDSRVIEAIKRSNLLEASKVYREVHSNTSVTIGLDEAKSAVEELKGRLGI